MRLADNGMDDGRVSFIFRTVLMTENTKRRKSVFLVAAGVTEAIFADIERIFAMTATKKVISLMFVNSANSTILLKPRTRVRIQARNLEKLLCIN